MGIYDELGVRPVINATATLTKLGGSVMPPEVVAAMQDAARHFVDLDELQARIGEKIAQWTGNEAAFVSSGAAAGLALTTAACVAGCDPEAVRRLPDLTGLTKTEVIVHKNHRNGYDHAVRQVGVRLVEIGGPDGTSEADLRGALSERTAAVFWFQGGMSGPSDLPLEKTIEVAGQRGVPVVVDAAAQLPPVENLWRFTRGLGAAAAVFSGGKDLRGPQSSGLVVGRRDIVAACRVHSSPFQSIGRPMKVGKEEMAGLLAAVKRYLALDHAARAARDEAVVARWCDALNALPGVCASRAFPNEAGQPLPWAKVQIDAAAAGTDRDEIIRRLWDDSPRIAVGGAGSDALFLNPMTVADDEVEIVLARLVALLKGAG